MKKVHNLVYKITNLVNNRYYVGVHKTKNVNDNYFGSGLLISRSLEKYGLSNFKKEILFDFDTYEEALEKEKEIVNQEFIEKEETYNLYIGGTPYFYLNKKICKWCKIEIDTGNYTKYHGKHCKENPNRVIKKWECSDETREKLRTIKDRVEKIKCKYCGKSVLPWLYSRLHGVYCKNNPNKVLKKPVSDETKKKMSLSHKNKEKLICEYCGKQFDPGNYSKSHGANCKDNPTRQMNIETKKCNWCNNQVRKTHYDRFHGDNCKDNPDANPYNRLSKKSRELISKKVKSNFKVCGFCNKEVDAGNYVKHHKNGHCIQ